MPTLVLTASIAYIGIAANFYFDWFYLISVYFVLSRCNPQPAFLHKCYKLNCSCWRGTKKILFWKGCHLPSRVGWMPRASPRPSCNETQTIIARVKLPWPSFEDFSFIDRIEFPQYWLYTSKTKEQIVVFPSRDKPLCPNMAEDTFAMFRKSWNKNWRRNLVVKTQNPSGWYIVLAARISWFAKVPFATFTINALPTNQ